MMIPRPPHAPPTPPTGGGEAIVEVKLEEALDKIDAQVQNLTAESPSP